MLGRRDMPPEAKGKEADPWDRAVLQRLASRKRLTFRLQHVAASFHNGHIPGTSKPHDHDLEIAGSGTVPDLAQHVHVALTFHKNLDHFGHANFTWQYQTRFGDRHVVLPVIQVLIGDPDGRQAAATREAMREAVLSGQDGVDVGVVWTLPEGVADDTLDTRIDVSAFAIWGQLHHPSASPWQRPIGEDDYTDFPEPRKLRLEPKDRR